LATNGDAKNPITSAAAYNLFGKKPETEAKPSTEEKKEEPSKLSAVPKNPFDWAPNVNPFGNSPTTNIFNKPSSGPIFPAKAVSSEEKAKKDEPVTQEKAKEAESKPLFGNAKSAEKPAIGGGIFGNKESTPAATGGLFGTKPLEKKPSTGGMFGTVPSASAEKKSDSIVQDKKPENEKPKEQKAGGSLFG